MEKHPAGLVEESTYRKETYFYSGESLHTGKPSGTYFPVSGEVVPIFANEKMTGMAIVCRNISEEEMQRRFFNMAVEESSIYPWQYNMHMNRFHFPGGLLRRFGYTDDTDLLARDEMDTLIHPEDLLHTRRNFDCHSVGQ